MKDWDEVARMDLQWFAAEDEGRTEEPSEYKIRKAREEGRVAKSQELVGALVLLLPAAAIWILASYILTTCMELIQFFFQRAVELDPVKDRAIAGVCLSYFVRMAAPIMAVALAAGIFANLVQTGFLFTTKPLTPDFSRIVPHFGRYFKRTIGSVEGLFNFFKSLFKMIIIGMVAYLLISAEIGKLATLQSVSLWTGLTTVASLAIRLLIIIALLLLALSVPDILFQRWQYRESLKMTIQEVKEERKMYEGDPMVRNRIRQRMRELITRNMAANVPKADVVVTNPTHFAVALEYNRDTMSAPQVTAKGADEMAAQIKEIAREHDVPIVENKPLARALYAETEVGDSIPLRYYEAVAALLKHVYMMNNGERRSA
ncbi:MAG: flagellar biosynthesis protein FlhB [Treponema sp.]|jgi:flagellar biosynthetic protein FlhB|nr:flagellar biosynthesis protein FlhB [Treponema sp.]